ncbi:hypothetical protein [Streptomyces sp. NPDC058108]|uniref:hypothetical protein n=1 Tax=Streptomyces sp. NPDC058108 TaxID=3346344 RepID=UPI0036F07EFB
MNEEGERGMGEAKRMRRLTSAERHVNRALGRPDVEEVEVDTRSSWDQHRDRVLAERRSAKPAGMQTSDYYGERLRAVYGTPDTEEPEAEEVEPEEEAEPAAVATEERTHGSWGFRPGGGMYLRTGGGGLIV